MKLGIPFLILNLFSTAICVVNSSLAIYLCKTIRFEPTLVVLAVGELIPLVGIIIIGTSRGEVLFMSCLVVSCVTSLVGGIMWLARIIKDLERMASYLESSYQFTICLISMFILSQMVKILLTHFISSSSSSSTQEIEIPKDEESFAMKTILNYKASAQTLVGEQHTPAHYENETQETWCNDNNDSVKIHKQTQNFQEFVSAEQPAQDRSSQQFDPQQYKVHNHKESLKSKKSLEFEKSIIRNISNSLLPPVLQQGKSDISYLRNEMIGTLGKSHQNNHNDNDQGKSFIDDLSDIPESYPQKELWSTTKTGNISHISLKNWKENYNEWNQRQERRGVTTDLYQLNPEFRNTEQLFHNDDTNSLEHLEQERSFGAPSLYSFSNNKLREVESHNSSTMEAKMEFHPMAADAGSKQTLVQEEDASSGESKGKQRRSSIATFKNTSPIKKLRDLKNEIRTRNSVHHQSTSSLTSSIQIGTHFASAPTSPVKRKTHSFSKSISCFHVSSQSFHQGDCSLRAVNGFPEKTNLSALIDQHQVSDLSSSRESSQGSCPSMFVGQYDREKWTKLKSKGDVIV